MEDLWKASKQEPNTAFASIKPGSLDELPPNTESHYLMPGDLQSTRNEGIDGFANWPIYLCKSLLIVGQHPFDLVPMQYIHSDMASTFPGGNHPYPIIGAEKCT